MLGNHNLQVEQLILDTSTISQIFSAFHPPLFPTLWEYFDRLVLSGFAISVAAVRAELQALGRVAGAVAYLENLNRQFFASPTQDEQYLVEEMTANNALTSSSNRLECIHHRQMMVDRLGWRF